MLEDTRIQLQENAKKAAEEIIILNEKFSTLEAENTLNFRTMESTYNQERTTLISKLEDVSSN